MKSLVTRGGQITIGKQIRDLLGIKIGAPVEINILGKMIIVEKSDENIFEKTGNFLPKNFKETLSKIRSDETSRLKRLKIL